MDSIARGVTAVVVGSGALLGRKFYSENWSDLTLKSHLLFAIGESLENVTLLPCQTYPQEYNAANRDRAPHNPETRRILFSCDDPPKAHTKCARLEPLIRANREEYPPDAK